MRKPKCCHCGGNLKSSVEVFGCSFAIEADYNEIGFLYCENCHHTSCLNCKGYTPKEKVLLTVFSVDRQLVEV